MQHGCFSVLKSPLCFTNDCIGSENTCRWELTKFIPSVAQEKTIALEKETVPRKQKHKITSMSSLPTFPFLSYVCPIRLCFFFTYICFNQSKKKKNIYIKNQLCELRSTLWCCWGLAANTATQQDLLAPGRAACAKPLSHLGVITARYSLKDQMGPRQWGGEQGGQGGPYPSLSFTT